MNSKQRARWIAELISDAQRLVKHAHGKPEEKQVASAIESLRQAREKALGDDTPESDAG
jgi:predicted RNA polymerase sigma factor